MSYNPNEYPSQEDHDAELIFNEELQLEEIEDGLRRWEEMPVGPYGRCSGCGNDLCKGEKRIGLCYDCRFPERPLATDMSLD